MAVASCFLPPPVPHAGPFKALWWYFPEIIHHPRNPKLHSSRPNVSAHMWYCLLYCICRLSPPLFCFPSVDHWWWTHLLLPRESGRNATHWSTPRELQKTKIGRKIASRLQNLFCWDLLPEDQYETRFQDWCTTIMQLCGARIIEDTCWIMFAQSLECLSEAQVHIPHLTCTRFPHTWVVPGNDPYNLLGRFFAVVTGLQKKTSSYLTNIIGMSRFQSSWKWKMDGNGEPQRLVVASLPAAVRIPGRSHGPALLDGIAWQWRIATRTFTASSLSVSLLVSNREGKMRFQHADNVMVFLHRRFAKLYWRTVALHAIEVQWLVTMMGMAYVAEDTGHFFF